MTREDLPLVWEWLQRPHVKEWWRERDTYEELVEHYLPSIEGTEPTDLYVALLDDAPIGYLQTYVVSDHPEYAALVDVGEGVAGVDLLIGEEALTGQGIGTEMLRRFTDEIVFAEPATIACIAGPEATNAASIRAFEKAGFRVIRDFVEDGKPHTLVRRDR
jgi:aminoglycoside 6'-N-acetyltransferase-1b/aminoglycoside 6'-N-acetyltransferase-2